MYQASQPDRALAAIAARQRGNVTREQALQVGLTPRQIVHRLATGRLIERHRCVYAVGHVVNTPLSRAAAALLACGPGTVLSHSSAAALWEIVGSWEIPLEVTVPGQRRPTGIRVHRSTNLAWRDVVSRHGLAVTSAARTLLAIAPTRTEAHLARAYNELWHRRCIDPSQLAELLERCPNQPGAGKLRPLLERRGGPTRSELEDAFLRFVHAHGLPEPETNVIVAGYLVDAYFREQRVIVELDSVEYHTDRTKFESDRERDAATLATGHRTVRVTDRRMRTRPAEEAARLRVILAL
jgi:very-short-patch-repair endonuclease